MGLKALLQTKGAADAGANTSSGNTANEDGLTAPVFYPLDLKRFHTKDGAIVVPNEEGVFVPNTQEEFDILCWHLEQGRVSLTDPSVVDEGQNPDDVTE